MNGWTKAAIAVALLALVSCTDAKCASRASVGSPMRVKLYSGGELVGEWTSTGKVESGEHGTRFAFKDKETGAYVRVMGNVSVEEIK